MKGMIVALAFLGSVFVMSSANAQYVTVYSPPVFNAPVPSAPVVSPPLVSAPVVVARPVSPRPLPVMTYRPPAVLAQPAVAPLPAPTPLVPVTPAYQFYTPYGGTEVRVPGQPIANFFRAITP